MIKKRCICIYTGVESAWCLGCACVKANRRCSHCRPASVSACRNLPLPGEATAAKVSIQQQSPPSSCPPTDRETDLTAEANNNNGGLPVPSRSCSPTPSIRHATRPNDSSVGTLEEDFRLLNLEASAKTYASALRNDSSIVPTSKNRHFSTSSVESAEPAGPCIVMASSPDPQPAGTGSVFDVHVRVHVDRDIDQEHDLDPRPRPHEQAQLSSDTDPIGTNAAADDSNNCNGQDCGLPSYTPSVADKNLIIWSDEPDAVDGSTVVDSINAAYSEVMHWRQNLFTVPYGQAGKAFVMEVARLFGAFADHSNLECVALKAAMVLPALVLQKPHSTSRAKDHVQCLTRRMRAWRLGHIDELVREGRTIQHCLPKSSRHGQGEDHFQRTFAKLIFDGKVSSAMRLLADYAGDTSGKGVLALNSPESPNSSKTVRDVLIEKHPDAAPVFPQALINTNPSDEPVTVHPVYFDRLTGAAVRQAALRTKGAAGPSGMNADNWRRICTAFKRQSADVCDALAATGRRLCCEMTDPTTISALSASRLIPLDKNPGVRPIGICEVSRRIIGKAVLSILSPEIQQAAGSLQLCAGQPCGIEAAIHAMHTIFEDPETDGVLLVDARNAFNSLNREVALRNMRWICPEISTILANIYREPAQLFAGGEVFLSREGTTQGDPLAMAMYGLAVMPLIRKLAGEAKQVWFADDATGGGKLRQLRWWWDRLIEFGPAFGYFPNAAKTSLVVKECQLAEAQDVFSGTGVQITADGHRLLGSPIGTPAFRETFIAENVSSWTHQLEALATVARTEPHAAYAAFIHGFVGKWTFLARTTDSADRQFHPMEDCIREKLIPRLTGRSSPGADVRKLLALPARLGGLGLINPAVAFSNESNRSKETCSSLASRIQVQQPTLGDSCHRVVQQRASATNARRKALREEAAAVKPTLPESLQRSMDIFSDKGASHWLTVVPVSSHGFALPKTSFRDALCLRYGWQPEHLPVLCSCGQAFNLDHALSCVSGGYSVLRHNELRDLTAAILSEVCHGVELEPPLVPLSGEQLPASSNTADDARLDIAARGFWGNRFSRTLFDVRVFHPNAPSARTASLTSQYNKHERSKRRQYEPRVRDVEGASFVPLIFSTAGGMGPACSTTFKRLANLLADRLNMPYSAILNWLRTRTSFALLRSTIVALRGSRRSFKSAQLQPALALSEGHLAFTH